MRSVNRHRVRRSIGIAGCLLLCTTLRVSAQDTGAPKPPEALGALSLEQLVDLEIDSVYAASNYAQKITEAPASITIVTRDEIDRFGYRTLADILRNVRGFYVTNDRNYSYLGVRGFNRPGDYNARILLLIDGHRLNDNVFGSALLGTEFPLDLGLIERVEIVRGPSSSLYGTSAFFAVINVVTKRADRLKGFDVSGTVGTFGTRQGRVSYGRTFAGGAQMVLSGSAYDSDGQRRLYFKEFDSPATHFGVASNADADTFVQFLGKASVGRFTAQALYGSREKIVPTASFGTVFDDPRSGTIEMQAYADVQYDRTFGNDWSTGARLYYDRYAYDGTYVFGDETDPFAPRVLNLDFARGSWWGGEVKARKRFGARHTVSIGSEYRDNLRQDQYNYDADPYVLYLDDRRRSSSWAVHAQDEIKLPSQWLLNLGVRHDQYDSFGGTTNPRMALIYNPAGSTTMKLLYGQAFRAPNIYELYWFQDDIAKANPDLRPESNRTAEVVLEQGLGSGLRGGVTAFHYAVNDLITQQTDRRDDLLVYNNAGRIEARGLELDLDGRWAFGSMARASYTYQHSRDQETGLPLTNSPVHLVQTSAAVPLPWHGFSAGLATRYMSERLTVSGGRVDPVTLTNLTILGRSPHNGFEVSASIFNLFDARWEDPGSEEHRQDGIVQNGRTLRLRLTYRFGHRH